MACFYRYANLKGLITEHIHFASCLYSFSGAYQQCPSIVCNHGSIPFSLISSFHFWNIFMESLFIVLNVRKCQGRSPCENVGNRFWVTCCNLIDDTFLEDYSQSQCIFNSSISQEAKHNFFKCLPCCFLMNLRTFSKFLPLRIWHICRPMKMPFI